MNRDNKVGLSLTLDDIEHSMISFRFLDLGLFEVKWAVEVRLGAVGNDSPVQ